MRGRIIHYNSNDGRGLISAAGKQYPFEVADWQSEIAPALNTLVDFEVRGDRPVAVSRVPDETRLREKAGELAGRIGALTGSAGLGNGGALGPAAIAHLGKPLLVAHGAFVFGALVLTYIRLEALGMGSSFTLAGLSKLGMGGFDVGNPGLVWLAIFSPLVPLFWRNRWAWVSLVLPLFAVTMPWLQLRTSLSRVTGGSGAGSEFGAQMQKQLSGMVDFGLGAWVCAVAALVLAVIGLRRAASHAD